jgi:hypothetical protein
MDNQLFEGEDRFCGIYLNLYPELFYRNIHELNFFGPESDMSFTINQIFFQPQDAVIPVEYVTNKYKYRSNDFTGKEELLILGCSQTFGHGMPNEFTWPYILAESLNMDFARLALGGDSLQGQVIKAFEYFEKFGHPKIIVGTFPLYRMEIPYVKDQFEVKDKRGHIGKKIQQLQIPAGQHPKLIKSPYDAESVIKREIAIFYNFMFIKMLERYCESNNIKLIWNIWEDHKYQIYNYINNNEKIKHILKNYFIGNLEPYNTFSHSPSISADCHQEFKNHPLFNHGSDLDPNTGGSHWGLHKHIHIAEEFHQKIMI